MDKVTKCVHGEISPTLANMTLNGLQTLLDEKFPRKWDCRANGWVNPKVNFVRYADDFIVTGDSKELLEYEVRPLIEAFLNERGLRLSPEKTKITPISEGIDFLGQNIRSYNGVMLVTPSKKNTLAFLAKIRERINANKGATHENLIRVLNPVIRGWANYHRHICAKRTFGRADHAIWRALWRWAKRRHNNKPVRWVIEKYWHLSEGRGWRFAADTGERTPEGKPIRLRLEEASATPIRCHVKIKGKANPFDPEWRDYFEDRVLLKRYGEEFVEKYGFLLRKGKQRAKPVMETGSATAEL